MPDLGKYAADVYAAYGITFLLLAGLLWGSLRRAARVKQTLAEAELRLSELKEKARKNG